MKLIDKSNKFINFQNIDGFNKTYNLIWCPRYAGKTVQAVWKKLINCLKNKKGSVLFLYRYANQINNETIKTLQETYNYFIKCDTDDFVDDEIIELTPLGGNMDTGFIRFELTYPYCRNNRIIDYKKRGIIKDKGVSGGILWIGTKEEKLKSLKVDNLKYIVFDEYIVNPESEKYGDKEFEKIITLITTLNRYSGKNKNKLKCYFLGNTYSKYNPFIEYFKIDENKLKPGCKFSGSNWAVWAYQLPKERIDELKSDPALNYINDDYNEFLFGGKSKLTKVVESLIIKRPQFCKLKWILFYEDNYYGINLFFLKNGLKAYYVEKIKTPSTHWIKPIYCFNKLDLAKNIETHKLLPDIKILENFIKKLNYNMVYYKNEGCYYFIYKIFESYIKNI